eukprot:NODE_159_length_15043_cov_0.440444.p8 type:complete len:197 gc:universal NODE_159_length_15043_cov_0.440444:2930-3520(+)
MEGTNLNLDVLTVIASYSFPVASALKYWKSCTKLREVHPVILILRNQDSKFQIQYTNYKWECKRNGDHTWLQFQDLNHFKKYVKIKLVEVFGYSSLGIDVVFPELRLSIQPLVYPPSDFVDFYCTIDCPRLYNIEFLMKKFRFVDRRIQAENGVTIRFTDVGEAVVILKVLAEHYVIIQEISEYYLENIIFGNLNL